MWICLNDAFFSIVQKECPPGTLLVRARRPGDIEKVFGRRVKVTRNETSDYLFRAVIPKDDIKAVMASEIDRITYDNFKDSVSADDLHKAYMEVWTAMSRTQNPPPYSGMKWMPDAWSHDQPVLKKIEKTYPTRALPKGKKK